jgi:hypothetical protein
MRAMRTFFVPSMAAALVFGLAACGSSGSSVAPSAVASPAVASPALAAGTVTGQVSIPTGSGLPEIYLCTVSTNTPGTPVAAAEVDWSGIVSHGLSAKNGFDFQGNVRAPGFACTLGGLKSKLNSSAGGSAQAFTITGASPGKYALVVILADQTGRLVSGADGVPVTVELSADRGADVGSVTVTPKATAVPPPGTSTPTPTASAVVPTPTATAVPTPTSAPTPTAPTQAIIKATPKMMAVVDSWGKTITVWTPATNPLTDLKGLTSEQVGFWNNSKLGMGTYQAGTKLFDAFGEPKNGLYGCPKAETAFTDCPQMRIYFADDTITAIDGAVPLVFEAE